MPASEVIVAACGMNRAMTHVAQHRASVGEAIRRDENVDVPRHFAKRVAIGQRADHQSLEEQQGNGARSERVAQLAAQKRRTKAMGGSCCC